MNWRPSLSLLLLLSAGSARAQLNVSTSMTPVQLVENVLLGGGVSVSNVTFNGVAVGTPQQGTGSFTNGNTTNLGLDAGIILSSGFAPSVVGPASNFGSDQLNTGSDPDLVAITTPGNSIQDKAVLEFDFIPTGDSLKFNYVFGSEEYPSFNCSANYNDVFGFFLSGPGINGPYTNNAINIALVPGTTLPVSIANIHGPGGSCGPANQQYYVNNENGSTIALNGFTVVLRAEAEVTCGLTYHIKLAIGDAGDGSYNSAVFLQAGSFASTGQVVPTLLAGDLGLAANDSTLFEGCGLIPFNFMRMGDTSNVDTVHLVIGGTATPGVDYFPPFPTQIIYQPGDTMITFPLTVPYDADGLETITINITQNVVCSGMQVVNDYVFYIDQYPLLGVSTTDVNGVCNETYDIGPAVTGGTGEYQYLWSTGETTPTIVADVDTTTTFYVTVSDTCGVPSVLDSITVHIPPYPPMALTASPDLAIPCLGNDDIEVLNTVGGDGNYTYLWTQGGAAVGTGQVLNVPAGNPLWYVATATDGCGKSASDSVLVSTQPLDGIAIASWDSTVFCTGDTVVLVPFGVTGGNGVYTYSWADGMGTVLSTADTVQVAVPTDATYVLHVQDQCGYAADSLFTVRYPRYQPFVINLTPDSTICAGDSILLWAHISGGSGVHTIDWQGWAWSDPKMTYSGDQDATFIVDVLDQCGEFISATTNVTVQHPWSKILIAPRGQDDWLFHTATYPDEVPVVIWDLGDGTRIKADSVTHSYYDLEDHWITLHTVSAEGCKAMDSLLVIPPATLFFPNAFTPDGDGVNDTFGPVFSSVDEFHMIIFDRWGHVVFETDDIHKQWDGKVMGGNDAATSVYVYKYRAKGHYFEAHEKFGYVTLLRGNRNR
ncbi:MAG TPA: choice-of-anchor L domain-containing protein [Flavobacteriales bacterium]|nr:choice-of-anchor L domain-containing protein [Flavobacteriales bacterium]HRP81851.1 choice-of-anchor L domain-containing protein [Flavobacteriales bacterium]HRQ83970.1 choice-of-anchor L domain-containing protein [Flavobacteriales bacterium]